MSTNTVSAEKTTTTREKNETESEISSSSSSSLKQHGQRILWNGPHFGRLTRTSKSFLLRNGWIEVSSPPPSSFFLDRNDDKNSNRIKQQETEDAMNKVNKIKQQEPLAFLWPSKSGPQYSIHGTYPAYVRPYPTQMTLFLEDKVQLAKLTAGANIMPLHFSTASDDDASLNKDQFEDQEEQTAQQLQQKQHRLYFVKHRLGAQGKSVNVHDYTSLKSWLQSSKNVQDFVIQEEVKPALDDTNRKFVLRAHLLLYHRDSGGGDSSSERRGEIEQERNNTANTKERNNSSSSSLSTMMIALHRDIINLPHATPYEGKYNAAKSSHISQYGKTHPKPRLVSELDESHPAVLHGAQDQIKQLCVVLSQLIFDYFHLGKSGEKVDEYNEEEEKTRQEECVQSSSLSTTATITTSYNSSISNVTCFALMGLDFLLSDKGIVKLCEVNTHPALGWGSMSSVDKCVYDRLLQETLEILLHDEEAFENAGFERVEFERCVS